MALDVLFGCDSSLIAASAHNSMDSALVAAHRVGSKGVALIYAAVEGM